RMFAIYSSSSAAATGLKKALNCLGKGFGGAEPERVHARAAEPAIEFCEAFRVGLCELLADGCAAGGGLHQFAWFSMLDRHKARCGERRFTRIMQVQTDEVVARVRQAHLL